MTTLERWGADAVSRPARERVWTAAARLEAVIATAALNEAQRNAWCRAQGLYPTELEKWARALEDGIAFQAFSCEYIANILEMKARSRSEPGALSLTRRFSCHYQEL